MNRPKLRLFTFFFIITGLPFSSSAQEEGLASDSVQKPAGFYIYTDQDRFLNKFNEDRNYTMGVNIGFFGPGIDKRCLLIPYLRKKIDRFLGIEDFHCKNPWQFSFPGFNFFVGAFTPLNLDTINPIVGDRPYASILGFSSSYISANRRKGYAVLSEFTLGFLGLGIAPAVQTWIHEEHLLGSTRPTPKGWHNQISDGGEPTFMYRLGYRKRLVEKRWNEEKWADAKCFQITGTAETMIGYYTNASAGAEVRLGFFSNDFWDMASGISTGASQAPGEEDKRPFVEAYLFGALRQRVVGYNALLQGQFRKTAYRMQAPDLERLIGEYEFGLGLKIWKVNLQWGIISGRTPEYRGEQARPHIWGNVMLRTTWNRKVKIVEPVCPSEEE